MNGCIRPAMLAALALSSLTLMAPGSSAIAAPGCRGTHQRPSAANLAKDAGATLCLINAVRHIHHLKPLRANSTLHTIASGQSHDMLVGGYFGDDSLGGLTPMQRIDTSAYARDAQRISVGQNIAWGQAEGSTPAAIVAAWLGSGPHREILLSPTYQDDGVGIGLGVPRPSTAGPGAIYTLDLAARAAA